MIEVIIMEGGPAVIKADAIIIKDREKINPHFSPIAICRCGKSKNQPYCDGSHKIKEEKKDETTS